MDHIAETPLDTDSPSEKLVVTSNVQRTKLLGVSNTFAGDHGVHIVIVPESLNRSRMVKLNNGITGIVRDKMLLLLDTCIGISDIAVARTGPHHGRPAKVREVTILPPTPDGQFQNASLILRGSEESGSPLAN